MANGRGVRPKICKDCECLARDGNLISFRGLCEPCAIKRQRAAAMEMHEGRGPAHEKWVERMRAAIGD